MTKGKQILEELASRFPQLYVAPAPDAAEKNRAAASRGKAPDGATLDHFRGTDRDELRVVDTPAGPVEVIYLADRQDFETFVQIVGHKSSTEPIAKTIGATTYSGLADWGAVLKACQDYVAAGGADWLAEFKRLASQPDAFRAQLIVISEGPYSNIDAAQIPYDHATWLDVSREIRLYHECAHVVCRRLMPEDIAPVWDEITADVCGLISATGSYPADLACLFLGVDKAGYQDGRLGEYLSDDQLQDIDRLSRQIWEACKKIEDLAAPVEPDQAFDFVLELKRRPLLDY